MRGQNLTNVHLMKQYESERTKMVLHLRKRITESETGANRFVVIPYEAGFGKSRETDRIVGDYIANGGTRRFLLVKRFDDDVYRTANSINELQPTWAANAALGLTSKDWIEYRTKPEELALFNVLIITHARYELLCRDTGTRRYFKRNRHTLIVDEAIDISTCIFSEAEYRKVQSYLPLGLDSSLRTACEGLISELAIFQAKGVNNRLVVCNPSGNLEKVNLFSRDVQANKHHIKNLNEVQDFICSLYCLNSNECIFNGSKTAGRIVTYDTKARRWGLRNNIILDANGMIDQQYELDGTIDIDHHPPFVDHSNWTLYHVDFNSSDSHIRATPNYFDEVCNAIADRQRNESKTLVITREKHISKLESVLSQHGVSNFEVAYFGNLLGKNDWRDFTQVWVVATPNYPFEDYALRWAKASGKRFSNKNMQLRVNGNTMMFMDAELESVRLGCIAGEIYQAVKRINRDNDKRAEVFIVNSNPKVIEAVGNCMKNVQYDEVIKLNLGGNGNGESKPRNTRAVKLVMYLMSLPVGVYPKKDVREAVGIDERNFSTVLKDASILQLKEAGIIRETKRTIEIVATDGLYQVG